MPYETVETSHSIRSICQLLRHPAQNRMSPYLLFVENESLILMLMMPLLPIYYPPICICTWAWNWVSTTQRMLNSSNLHRSRSLTIKKINCKANEIPQLTKKSSVMHPQCLRLECLTTAAAGGYYAEPAPFYYRTDIPKNSSVTLNV